MNEMEANAPPASARALDGFLAVQGLLVATLGALGLGLIWARDTRDAALIAVGLVGALAVHRKGAMDGEGAGHG
ncbi:MAG: hypothetical protein ACREEW_04665 [Caulobacteraceae bacterium]